MLRRTVFAAVVAIVVLASTAYAGMIIKSTSKVYGPHQLSAETTLYLGAGKLRMDTTDSSGRKQIVIFRKDKQLFWVINPAKGTYAEITKAQLHQMKQRMEEMKRQMKEAMKNMPPEQRAMMEKMMKERMPSMNQEKAPPVVYRKVGRDRVGAWQCTKYEGVVHGTKTEDVWVTPFSVVKVTPSDLETLKEMGDFFSELSSGTSSSALEDVGKWEKTFKGFPVKNVSYEKGKRVYEDQIEEVKRSTLSQKVFELPQGLRKETLMPPAH